LNGEVELSDGKVESIKGSVKAGLELELSKRTSLTFEGSKVKTAYDAHPPVPPPKESPGPEVTVGISRKIGGGDDKKEKQEGKKEGRRAGKEELEKARTKYEKTRDAIVAPLRKEIQDLAKEAMDLAVTKGGNFVADERLKDGGVTAEMEEKMKKAVDAYVNGEN